MFMTLIQLRRRIDIIDRQILGLLSTRQQVVVRIAGLKKLQHRKIYQPDREVQVLADKTRLAQKHNLSPKFVGQIFRLILAESKRIQRSLIK